MSSLIQVLRPRSAQANRRRDTALGLVLGALLVLTIEHGLALTTQPPPAHHSSAGSAHVSVGQSALPAANANIEASRLLYSTIPTCTIVGVGETPMPDLVGNLYRYELSEYLRCTALPWSPPEAIPGWLQPTPGG